MYIKLIPLICLLTLCYTTAQNEENSVDLNNNNNNSELAEQLYKKLFKLRRAEQLEAIKGFKKIAKYEKQYTMVTLMAEKVFTTIQSSRATIEASSYIPGVSPFPLEEPIREALSNILENTALFSEIILRFPDIAVSVLKTNNNWDVLLQWSIAFCNQVNYLLDKSTVKLLHLVSQELNHIEREPNYVNPHRKGYNAKIAEEQQQQVQDGKRKKKKPFQIKRGPRFTSHVEL